MCLFWCFGFTSKTSSRLEALLDTLQVKFKKPSVEEII